MYKQKSKLVRITSVVALTLRAARGGGSASDRRTKKWEVHSPHEPGGWHFHNVRSPPKHRWHVAPDLPDDEARVGCAGRPGDEVDQPVGCRRTGGDRGHGMGDLGARARPAPGWDARSRLRRRFAQKCVSDISGITSSDEGAHWAAPAQVGSGAQDEVQAYGAAVTGATSRASTPVWTLSVGGGLVVQQGFGLSSPTTSLLSGADHFASDVDSALDAGSQQVVVSWNSAAHNGGDFMETAAPKTGTRQAVPGQVKNEVSHRQAATPAPVFLRPTRQTGATCGCFAMAGAPRRRECARSDTKALGVATGVDRRDLGDLGRRGRAPWRSPVPTNP